MVKVLYSGVQNETKFLGNFLVTNDFRVNLTKL